MNPAIGLAIFGVLVAAGGAQAQSTATISQVPGYVLDYAREFERVRSATRPAPIEHLFRLGAAVGDSLVGSNLNGTDASRLALMDDSTFARTSRLMPGLDVIRDEVEGVLVDPDVFLALARERGDSADVEAFRAIKATMDSSYMPVYVEQLTDYSGCTRFGSGSLVDVYAIWSRFKARHPGRYADRARDELAKVMESLLTDDCPCTNRAAVVQELELFLDRFPRSSSASRIRARLGDVQSGRATIREDCRPG